MTAPTHTCTTDTCWAEHASDEHGQDRCLDRSGWTYCALPLGHAIDGSRHEHTLRLGPSQAQRRSAWAVGIRWAALSATAGLALGALFAVVTR